MLSLDHYQKLYAAITGRGLSMFTSPSEYERKHYWPKAYEAHPILKELSPACMWTDTKAFSPQHVKQFFKGAPVMVKDHVKSAKDASGIVFIKNSRNKEEVWHAVERLIKERGPLFERGIVFKEKIDIHRNAEGKNIEMRLFFIRGKAFMVKGNGVDYHRFMVPSELVNALAGSLGKGFYTVDIASVGHLEWKVIECGDGQVSGLTDQMDTHEFYRSLKWELAQREPGELDEHELEDDYEVHWDYLYVVDGKVVKSDIKGTVLMLKRDLRERGMEALVVTTCDFVGRSKKAEEAQ
jgi:hypothetical protein